MFSKKNRARYRLAMLSLVFGAAMVLSAWGIQGPDDSTTPQRAALSDTVEVTLEDGNIQVGSAIMQENPLQTGDAEEDSVQRSEQESVQAGAVTFEITNDGNRPHSFAISGEVEERLRDRIPSGESETLEVDLEPGTYTAYCPIGGHSENESTEITVEN